MIIVQSLFSLGYYQLSDESLMPLIHIIHFFTFHNVLFRSVLDRSCLFTYSAMVFPG